MKTSNDTIRNIFVGIVSLAVIGRGASHARATSAQETSASPAVAYLLKAEPSHCDKLYDNIRCEGRVTNISELPLRRVVALAECFTKDGGFVTSDWSGIEYDPVMAGQTSPYRVIIRYNPVIAGCRMSFKYLSGQLIPTANPDPPRTKSGKRTKIPPFDWNTATTEQRKAFCADFGQHCGPSRPPDPACQSAQTTCTSTR